MQWANFSVIENMCYKYDMEGLGKTQGGQGAYKQEVHRPFPEEINVNIHSVVV